MIDPQFRKAVPPHCADCGKSKPMALLRDGMVPDNAGGAHSHEWVCGPCLYIREHPDFEVDEGIPRERRVALQEEKLF